eukprot:3913844-Pleurochrysis_carterae.AAC.1
MLPDRLCPLTLVMPSPERDRDSVGVGCREGCTFPATALPRRFTAYHTLVYGDFVELSPGCPCGQEFAQM